MDRYISQDINITNGLISNEVTCFQQDNKGFMWIGTTNGLCRYDGYGFDLYKSNYLNPAFFTGNYVVDIKKDSRNGLFVLTTSGLNVLDLETGRVKKYRLSDMRCTVVNSMCFSKLQNILYIATDKGVVRFRNQDGSFQLLRDKYGKPGGTEYIQSVFLDSRDMLWVGTWGSGFYVYDTRQCVFRRFSSVFKRNAYLFFGGNKGLVYFNPSTFREDKFSPTPVISEIKISNLLLNNVYGGGGKTINAAPYFDKIRISSKDKSLEIEFSSLDFGSNHTVRYAYRLDGIDERWIYTHDNFAVYNNLGKGTYIFRVKAYNEDGYESKECRLIVEREPAWWESSIAYVLYILFTLLILYIVFRVILIRMTLRRKLYIARMERIKSDEVNQAKMQFFTNVSHELFTPITVLSCSLEEMGSGEGKNNKLLDIMRMNLSRLRRLIQQILEFRKADTGNLKLKVKDDLHFIVRLPIDRSSYSEDQIYTENEMKADNRFSILTEQNEPDPLNTVKKDISVLLVEDNKDLLYLTETAMKRNFNVYTAVDGADAVEKLERGLVVDIVVTDFLMPRLDGIGLCKYLKSKIQYCDIPIVLLTVKRNKEDKIVGFEAGADVYITKPYEMSTLIANIKSLVVNRRRVSASFKSEGNIKLSEFTYNSVDEDFLNNAIKVVEQSIVENSDFGISEFCKMMNMSQPTLYRKIKAMTSLSLSEFIRNIKFKLACKLLTERKLNVSETAYTLGFVDPHYFSIVFKKEIGMSPSDYVKTHSSLS